MKRYNFYMFVFVFLTSCGEVGKVSELNFIAPNAQLEHVAQLNYTSEIQMSNRYYVESVLLQVFNAKGTPAAEYIQTGIFERKEFGGACDLYAPSDNGGGPGTIEFPREVCFNGIEVVQASTNNPMRYSLTTKVCEQLIVDSSRMGAVRNKIFRKSTEWREADPTSIQLAWNLFYPIGTIPPEVLIEFQKLARASDNPKDAWENIILTLCISPDWQVL